MLRNFASFSLHGAGITSITGRETFSYNLHIDCAESTNTHTCADRLRSCRHSIYGSKLCSQSSNTTLGVKERRQVQGIDGRPNESGDILHIAKVVMLNQDHKEQLPMFVTKLGHYPIILLIPCLRFHDVAVRFASNTVTSGSEYCGPHCPTSPFAVQAVTEEPPEPGYAPDGILEPKIHPQRPCRGNIVMLNGSSFF